jgi:carboxymethylenebutenolidase
MPDISFPVGSAAWRGYLATPAASPGPWPAVVVIHEAFGLNEDIRRKADEFAGHGYLALAPDLFEGRSWIRCIRGAFSQLRAGHGPAFEALDGAREFLAARPTARGRLALPASAWAAGSRCYARRGRDMTRRR